MTYVLCDNDSCIHHDGDGCTLEFIEVNTMTTRDKIPRCTDCERTGEDED